MYHGKRGQSGLKLPKVFAAVRNECKGAETDSGDSEDMDGSDAFEDDSEGSMLMDSSDDESEQDEAGSEGLLGAHSALQSRYSEQLMALPAEERTQVRIQKLGNDATYQAAYTTIKNCLSTKGSRPTGNVDPQNNTAEDTITPDQYHKLMKLLLASEKPEWLRDRSIFAHMNLDEVGIDDKVIARMGKWNMQAMAKSYFLYFKPCEARGLQVALPFLHNLKETVKSLGKDVTNSMKSVALAMDYLAVVVVQDALEDAEEYPDNPVHALLLESPCFV
ncbi:hypothetical protein WJX75_009650 [Coccomyxa subellipsoidea]|uniref:Uncharacterized protein n=1 Tax=Coccomyxa subellipsoidea TaxID=248742 RepID=A0ABR2YAN8_9CHLO